MILVAVEGDTDVPFVIRLCASAGFDAVTPILSLGGKDELDKRIAGFAAAAGGFPHLVVRDLDVDAPCAAAWLSNHRPKRAGRYFCLRLAVRAIEAWFLADRDHAAAALRVPTSRLPLAPDDEKNPKQTLVNLARSSTKRAVRQAVVPASGASRIVGAGYSSWLLEAAEGWRVEHAAAASPSLGRAVIRLRELREAWPG